MLKIQIPKSKFLELTSQNPFWNWLQLLSTDVYAAMSLKPMSIMSRTLFIQPCLDILKTLKNKIKKSNSPQNKRGGVFINVDKNSWKKKKKRLNEYNTKMDTFFLQPKINLYV